MKQIETYASLSDYISSIKRNGHSLPNVAQVGEIGYDEYFIYDRIILTIDSNPALFTIAKNAGWNHLSNSAITISELGMVTIDMLIDAISNKTTLTSFDEFKYFTGINCIGNGLFSNCSSITSITIPSSVTIVGSDAFTGLAPNAIITYAGRKPKIVTDSDYGIFGKYHEYLTESKLFYANPDSLYFVNVSGDGFTSDFYPKEAKYITVSDLLDDVQYSGDLYMRFMFKENVIPEKFFSGVTTLYGAVINNSVTSLGNSCFRGCTSLTSITIPDSVTSIGDYCFNGCTGLINVTIGTGVTGLSYACFYNCTSLASIVIPDSVTSIGGGCFNGCTGLTSITIPDSVTSLGNSCFYNCGSLTSITIPDSVTSIGNSGFSNCSGLTSATIGTGVTGLSDYCFYGCSGLTSATIGAGVTSLGSYCFYSCTNLTSITIPNNVISLGSSCFHGCSGLTSITIPDSVTGLSDTCFGLCSGLTNVTIGTGVTGLSYACFAGCLSLTSITIPNNVTSIGERCFRVCSGLTNVTIGTGVTRLGGYCFSGCSSLTSITSNAINAPTISSTTFRGVKTKGILNYPAGSNYSTWMGTGNYYLGSYNWTSQEIS